MTELWRCLLALSLCVQAEMHKLGATSAASQLTHLWWLEQQHYIGGGRGGWSEERPLATGRPDAEGRPELMRRLQGHVAAVQHLLKS